MRILITGGTGSFGQAMTERLLDKHGHELERLVIFSRDEIKQEEFSREFEHSAIRMFIGDVRDQPRLELALRGIEYVVHAAALKIIPTAEYNPTETLATNVLGAENIVRAALKTGVKKVVALSTDKAASPCTLYGATKLVAEKIFTAANNLSGDTGCNFSSVRYGNIAGSRGSVIPLFKARKERGLPLQITSPEMTRYYFTLDKAIDLVFYAFKHMRGGEIFVPEMPSFKIVDLAEAIDPGGQRELIGIRGSEKVHEDIITVHESRMVAKQDGYYVILPPWRSEDGAQTFNLASGTNDKWLTMEELRRELDRS